MSEDTNTHLQPPHHEFLFEKTLPNGYIIERYRIIRTIGYGGFGVTYLALDTTTNQEVVIKENFPAYCAYRDPFTGIINPNNEFELQNFNWACQNFLAEARTLSELNHPGIVKILSIFESHGTAFICMEYITGLSLEYLSEKLHSQKESYTEDELRGLLSRLLNILVYLHGNNILHRDIKPSNILLNTEGLPILIDFGSARSSLNRQTATVVATEGFSPLEQIHGSKNTGPWSDLYSLAATFYTLLTGIIPQKSEQRYMSDELMPLSQIPQLQQLYSYSFLRSIDKALRIDIAERYASATDWLTALDLQDNLSTQATIRLRNEDIHSARTRFLAPYVVPQTAPLPSQEIKKSSKKTGLILIIFVLIAIGVYAKRTDILDLLHIGIASSPNSDTTDPSQKKPTNVYQQVSLMGFETNQHAPTEIRPINEFTLNFQHTALAPFGSAGLIPPRFRVRNIELQLGDVIINSEPYSLVIKNPTGDVLAQSDTLYPKIPAGNQPILSFSFPTLPLLSANVSYQLCFQHGTQRNIALPLICLKEDKADAPVTPKVRINTDITHLQQKTEEYSHKHEMINLFILSNEQDILQTIITPNTLPYLTELAHEGYPQAQYRLYYHLSLQSPELTSDDAINWLYRAAQGGYAPAQRTMGTRLLALPEFIRFQENTSDYLPKDNQLALSWLKKAAIKKDYISLYVLGIIYSQSWLGEPDITKANKLINYILSPKFNLRQFQPNQTILAFWLNNHLPANALKTVKMPLNSVNLANFGGIRLMNGSTMTPYTLAQLSLMSDQKQVTKQIFFKEVPIDGNFINIDQTIPKSTPGQILNHLSLELNLYPVSSRGIILAMPKKNQN